MSDDGEQAEQAPEAKGPQQMDPNLQAAMRMMEQLQGMGVGVQVDVQAEAERRALWQLLIARGVISGADYAAQVHAEMARMLAGILQQVEDDRLQQRQALRQVQPARGGDIILPERSATARRSRR